MGAEGNQIFPGADDNVTGTVATYKIAEAFMQAAKAGQRPRRSLMFAVWDAEERGLLGAWAYTEDPTRPLDKAVAILNMDLIGRNEEVPEGGDWRFRGLEIQSSDSNKNTINILGTVRSPELKTEAEKANRVSALELRFRYDNDISNLLRRSDHWPFIQCGIPGLWFLTGLHPDYHTIYDRPEKIDYAKMERVTRMVHQMAWDLAQQDGRPRLLPRK
jgi:Zn-dependent M28 family amino/carboxypeptidase